VNPKYPQVNARLPVNPASHVYTMLLPYASLPPSVPDARVAALGCVRDVPSQVAAAASSKSSSITYSIW
jgi:hypothetical protein